MTPTIMQDEQHVLFECPLSEALHTTSCYSNFTTLFSDSDLGKVCDFVYDALKLVNSEYINTCIDIQPVHL